MQLSRQDMFCNLLASTDQAALSSTDTLDWGAMGEDIDKELRWFVLNQRTATSAASAATLVITWQTSANNNDWTTIYTSATFTTAQLAIGTMLVNGLTLPTGTLRYNKLVFTSAAANWTIAPLLTAGIVRNDMPVE